MSKLKILIVAGTMNSGGIENQVMHLLRKSDPNKYSYHFTTTVRKPYYAREIDELNGKCIFISATEGKHLIRYARELYRILKSGNYDVVHSHELFHSGIVLLVARIAGIPVRIAHAHNWTDLDALDGRRSIIRSAYNQIMRRLILQNATFLCACSSLAGEFLYGKSATLQKNYQVLNNSVDVKKYIDSYERKEYGEFVDDGWDNVLHIGRFCPQKNQLYIVEIAKKLKEESKKIRILCAGDYDNNYGHLVRSEIEKNGIQDYMVLLGNRSDIDTLLRKSSAFILPSEYEGMPLALIEAQASGIPCVVSDTFSHEVDFGIDSIQWLSVTESVDKWIEKIMTAVRRDRCDKQSVVKAIQEKGFNSQEFTRKVCAIYDRAKAKN